MHMASVLVIMCHMLLAKVLDIKVDKEMAATKQWPQHYVLAAQVENFYTVTALSWKPDGSRLAAGSLTGAVDVWDACIRRARYRCGPVAVVYAAFACAFLFSM